MKIQNKLVRGARMSTVLFGAVCLYSSATAQESVIHADAGMVTSNPTIRSIEFKGGTLLAPQVLPDATTPFLGQPLDKTILDQITSVITDVYDKAGYTGVIAYMPEQQVADGHLKVNIIEGHISEIKVNGEKHVDSKNVLNALPSLEVGEPLRTRDLSAELDLANESPIKKTRVALHPGEKPGDIVADVNVVDQKPWFGNIGIDNSGTSNDGHVRVNGSFTYANLFDRDQAASLQYAISPLHPALTNLVYGGYTLPLYSPHLLLNAYVAESHSAVGQIQTAAGPLNYSGDTTTVGASLTRLLPRFGNYEQRLSASVVERASRNDCSIGGSSTGCGSMAQSYRESLAIFTYSGNYAPVSDEFSVGGLASLLHNFPGGGHASAAQLEAARANSSANLTVFALQFRGRLGRPSGFNVSGSLALQRASVPLIGSELFHAGGMATVRGYQEGEVGADNGIVMNLALNSPTAALPGGLFSASAFLDVAHLANKDGAYCDTTHLRTACDISSTGVQMQWDAFSSLRLRVALARALANGPSTAAGSWHGLVSGTYFF